MSHYSYLTPLFACILMAFFATPVMAQEVGVDATTDAEVNVGFPPPPGMPGAPMRPLDFIKARAQQLKQGTDAPIKPRGDLSPPRNGTSSDMRRGPDGMYASSTARGLKALVMMHGGVIKNRFRLAISHLNNLLERIDSRLEKMAEAGVDTASAVQLKVEAELAIDQAEADAKAVADFAATASDSDDRAAFKEEFQAKLRAAHQSVKAAHQAVMDAVRALVALAKEQKPKVDAEASVETSATVETDVQ